jgi:hypothetical protein
MKVKPESYKNLIAIENGRITKISNTVMRKPLDINKQNKYLSKNSICIVCDYSFLEKKINWSEKIKAICHPFRDESIFPNNIKKYNFSESDFCSSYLSSIKVLNEKELENKYDFVYFTMLSNQGIHCKGVYMLPLIDYVAKDLGLKGLVINYGGIKGEKLKDNIYKKIKKSLQEKCKYFNNLKIINKFLSPEKMCNVMLKSRSVLFSNIADASPRILTEAIIRNRPIIVNSKIYGGWKYVNEYSGYFFDGPEEKDYFDKEKYFSYSNSLKEAFIKALLLERSLVSVNFNNNYGFANSCKKLADIINDISGTNYKAVAFEEWKKILIKVGKNENWI